MRISDDFPCNLNEVLDRSFNHFEIWSQRNLLKHRTVFHSFIFPHPSKTLEIFQFSIFSQQHYQLYQSMHANHNWGELMLKLYVCCWSKSAGIRLICAVDTVLVTGNWTSRSDLDTSSDQFYHDMTVATAVSLHLLHLNTS